MSPVESVAGERWEQGHDCVVVVADSGTCVAVVGTPEDNATPEDWARLPLIIAAPELLRALEALMVPLRAAAEDGVKVDPAGMHDAIRRAAGLIARLRPAPGQKDNPFDGRGTGGRS